MCLCVSYFVACDHLLEFAFYTRYCDTGHIFVASVV